MEEVPKEVLNLNIKRSFTSGSIPATILKQSLDIYLPYVTKFVNDTINEGKFPAELKHSEVMPLFKKEEPLKKKNYRPVSLMPHLSKVFEIIIYKQINLYTEHKLSKFITSFRKLHGRKQSLDIYLPYTTKSVNYAISEGTFSAELKHLEVISLIKQEELLKKENYRPVRLMPHLPKVLGIIIYKQKNLYMENKLSKFTTSFRKLHGNQHSVVTILEKWRKAQDKKEYICINHDHLPTKLRVYGFSINALNLMCNHLKNRQQRVQINKNVSATKTVIAGVPQGAIGGPLSFIYQ